MIGTSVIIIPCSLYCICIYAYPKTTYWWYPPMAQQVVRGSPFGDNALQLMWPSNKEMVQELAVDEVLSCFGEILQGFAKSLQHCIKPPISVTSLYGRFSALNLPYKEVTEFWGLIQCCKGSDNPCNHPRLSTTSLPSDSAYLLDPLALHRNQTTLVVSELYIQRGSTFNLVWTST